MDTAKGTEFIKALLSLFKTNINLKNSFKSFVNLSCSCQKSMQLIVKLFCFSLIFSINFKFFN